jgi:hypothetical protein
MRIDGLDAGADRAGGLRFGDRFQFGSARVDLDGNRLGALQ